MRKNARLIAILIFASGHIILDRTSEGAVSAPGVSRSHFGLDSSSYASPAAVADGQQSVSTIGAGVYSRSEGEALEAAVSAEGRLVLTNTDQWGVEVPEAYLANSKKTGSIRFTAGRKKMKWSEADESWSRGAWQPRFRWDELNHMQVGLTGAFFSYEGSSVSATAFASPLYAPERARNCELGDDGQFKKSSPWCVPPAQIVQFGEENSAPIRYRIDSPDLSEIVLNPSIGANLYIGNRQGAWANGSWAYKPMNQVVMAVELDGGFQINEEEVPVIIHPQVAYHALSTLEVGYGEEPFSVWTSATYERPVMPSVSDEWTKQVISDSWTSISEVGYSLSGRRKYATRVDLGYLRQFGGLEADVGQFGTPGATQFQPHYDFRNALRARFRAPVPATDNFFLNAGWVEELSSFGRLLQAKVHYEANANFSVAVGADFILVNDDDPQGAATIYTDFLNRYRANDRVYGGVSYVF